MEVGILSVENEDVRSLRELITYRTSAVKAPCFSYGDETAHKNLAHNFAKC